MATKVLVKANWVECQASDHCWVDHCYGCAPFWKHYPVCPNCNGRLKQSERIMPGHYPLDLGEIEKAYCPKCSKHYDITVHPR
jgi:uncharacterized protein with PIN domain